jgi:hypothetical protein
MFAQIFNSGRVPPKELELLGGQVLADKIFPVRLNFAKKFVRVLCHTMHLGREKFSELSITLKEGMYEIDIEANSRAGVIKHKYAAVDISLVMAASLEVYFCARGKAQELSERMFKHFDKDESGYLEYDEFARMIILINSGEEVEKKDALGVPLGKRKKAVSIQKIQAELNRQTDLATLIVKSKLTEETLQEMYLHACTGDTSADSSKKSFFSKNQRNAFEASTSEKGVTANTFMLTIVTNKQMRDTVFEVQRQSKNMNLLYAALIFQNMIRRWLRKKRAQETLPKEEGGSTTHATHGVQEAPLGL